MEKQAYIKGKKIIRSCKTGTHIMGAYNYINNYRIMFGDTNMWKSLYDYCGRRRNYCE